MPKERTQISLDVPSETRLELEAVAAKTGMTLKNALVQAIHDLHEKVFKRDASSLIVGYLKLDRPGDVDETGLCAECGCEFGDGLWLRVHGDGSLSGPLCSRCASAQ